MSTTIDTPTQLYKEVFIQPTYIVIKPVFNCRKSHKTAARIENEKNLKDNRHNGILSKKATSNIKNSVNWLLSAAQSKPVYSKRERKTFYFKVNFITLTIPPQSSECVTGKVFQQCLNTWLTYARKYMFLDNYVWKVERHKDNRLHIHLTTDTFIHYRKLRDSWNRILQRKGLLQEHYNKFNNYDPNSTDVHSVYKVRNIGAYIAKYMSKSPEMSKDYRGRIWGCSSSLSNSIKCKYQGSIYWGSDDYEFLDTDGIRVKQIRSNPDSMGLTKHLADLCLLNLDTWDRMIDCYAKRVFLCRVDSIRDGTRELPSNYATIDFFGGRSEQVNEIISNFDKENLTCKTEASTPRIGTIQLDLAY